VIVIESCVQGTLQRLAPEVPREWHVLKRWPQLAIQEPVWKHSTNILCLVPYQCFSDEGAFIQHHLPLLISVWTLSELIYMRVLSKVHLN